MVGGGRAGSALGVLEQRPAQHLRSLAGQVARTALGVGAVHGYVQAGVAHDRVAVDKAAGVAQLGQDGGRQQHPDPVVAAGQRTAAGLAAGEGAPPALQRLQLVDLAQRGRDLQAAGRRQYQLLQPAAGRLGQQGMVGQGRPWWNSAVRSRCLKAVR